MIASQQHPAVCIKVTTLLPNAECGAQDSQQHSNSDKSHFLIQQKEQEKSCQLVPDVYGQKI